VLGYKLLKGGRYLLADDLAACFTVLLSVPTGYKVVQNQYIGLAIARWQRLREGRNTLLERDPSKGTSIV
jgi:hypothetical protein